MTIKPQDNKANSTKGMLGFGDRVEKSGTNFSGGTTWMSHIQRGTLKVDPTLQNKSLDEILTEGGLNFPVALRKTHYEIDGIWYPSESHSVIRMDTKVELGHGFSDGYSPISYPDILNQFFQGAIDLGGIPTRVVSFQGGAKGAMQFAMPEQYLVADRPHKTFLNFYSSHDGSFGVTMNTCDICIVCGNTFRYSFNDTTAKWTVKHTVNMQRKMDDIRPKILAAEYAPKAYYYMLDKASTIQASDNTVKQFLFAMFPDGEKKENGKLNQGPANQRDQLANAIGNTAAERNTSDVTIYDVFQGALRYTSYRQQNRNMDEQFQYAMDSDKNQLAYNWMAEAVK